MAGVNCLLRKFIIFASLLISLFGCSVNQVQTKDPILVGISIKKNKCELVETGSGYKDNYAKIVGEVKKLNSQVYDFALEIPEKQFKEKLGSTCFLRGFNRTTGQLDVIDNEVIRKQSCAFYQLLVECFIFMHQVFSMIRVTGHVFDYIKSN